MNPNLTFVFCLIAIVLSTLSTISAQERQEIPFNDQWEFHGQSVSGVAIDEMVTLPHSWNKTDAQEGIPYYRGDGTYKKKFNVAESWHGKRVFIRFEGANITAKVSLNGLDLGTHKGGYAAFSYEMTDHLLQDQENEIEVVVNNAANLEVIPLVGDFNNYGGIYRPVQLIVTDPVCITPLDYASPGIYLKQSNVSEESAEVSVLTKISNGTDADLEIGYETFIIDNSGEIVESQATTKSISTGTAELTHRYMIQNPHLWNGKKDPYLYQVKVELLKNGIVIDSKTEPLGLRYFSVDENEGFFLNGEPIDLRGVSRHQDRKDKASAISEEDHRQDMDLMLEMGINSLRLAHYQHAEVVYDMTDEAGIVVWAELPWVGMPSGFLSTSNGYENTEVFRSNAKQQLYELIRQNYNHPSILMWGIFNEIQNPEGAEPTDFIEELNIVVKAEDPDRFSVGASMLSPQEHVNIHGITDIIAWNRYFGWYYKEPKDMALFLDQLHTDFPDYKVGISEYGAGGSIYQHADKVERPNPMGSPHPEEWQSFYHEEHLKIFDERPYVWGTYVWNMFDFGSQFRKEGDHFGINDKGMVTYDRKTKKDAFYFYKSNWSEEPVLHITSSRFIFRKKAETQVKVYTNLSDVLLKVNGKEFESKSPEKGIIIWEGITLELGNNSVVVRGSKDGKTYTDDCVWVIEKPYEGMNLFIKIFDFMKSGYQLAFAGLIGAFLIWLFGIRKRKKRPKWKKVVLWTFIVLLALISALIAFGKYYMSNMIGG
jgi:beta-galactosidase